MNVLFFFQSISKRLAAMTVLALLFTSLTTHADTEIDRTVHQVVSEVYDVAFDKKGVRLADVMMEDSLKPFLRIETDGTNHRVILSEAFVHLLANLAEARAIENQRSGFLGTFAKTLLDQNPGATLDALIDYTGVIPNPEKFENEKTSYFGQMLAVYLAAEIVHHQDLRAGRNGTRGTDWEGTMLRGMRIALDAGYATDGVLACLECLNQMRVRPEWTITFCPADASFGSIRKKLQNLERAFFSGKLE